ncbi:MAG: ATP-dependent protease ATPase subunit HslU, partial [Cytophagia bacterium]|nr:ATP-dependent protease ATPase subunit HslU [Cytophagia bacterium]
MIDQNYLTPRQIVAELDKYIIGQNDAKKNVAIALRNRWRRMHVKSDMQREIVPNNILMIGATGVGKTEIARRLAKIADAPFTKVEASKFTEVGYVGRDVESMVRDLVEQSVKLVKQTKKAEVKVRAEQAVEDIILDALIPPVRNSRPTVSQENGEAEDANKMSDAELNERTRERFREKIRSGEIDDRKIEISVQAPQGNGLGMIGGGMDEASMINLQDMLQNMMPKKSKKRKVTIEEAKKLLLEEESSKLIDMDEVKDEAIKKAENTGIIFIDEVDKIAGSSKKGGGGGPDVSREGVQRDLLPIVEGSAVNTKYGVINTDHILFIAAGAFHVAKPSDLIPELQGRFPIRVELNSLTQEHFYQILKEPKNALTKQYMALIGAEDVSLEYTDESLQEIARIAFYINEEVENIGARRLHTVMSRLLNEILFDIPEQIPPNAKVVVTKEMVQER